MLISRLSPTTILRAEAMLLNSSAVPRTIRRCILRPSGPASRHLKHQTSGPRLRRSTVTLPSCIPSPFTGRLKTGDMLTGVVNLRRLAGSKVRLNAALRRQWSLILDYALRDCLRFADDLTPPVVLPASALRIAIKAAHACYAHR